MSSSEHSQGRHPQYPDMETQRGTLADLTYEFQEQWASVGITEILDKYGYRTDDMCLVRTNEQNQESVITVAYYLRTTRIYPSETLAGVSPRISRYQLTRVGVLYEGMIFPSEGFTFEQAELLKEQADKLDEFKSSGALWALRENLVVLTDPSSPDTRPRRMVE